jgi:hypothetical protein
MHAVHDSLIALTYVAMVLSPCIVASWGDVLSFEHVMRLVRSRDRASFFTVLAGIRAERLARMAALDEEPRFAAFRISWPPPAFANASGSQDMIEASLGQMTPGSIAFVQAQLRIGRRLASIAEANRVAAEAPQQPAVQEPVVAMETAEVPFAWVSAAERTYAAPMAGVTPSVEELEALYALETPRGKEQPMSAAASMSEADLVAAGSDPGQARQGEPPGFAAGSRGAEYYDAAA